MALTLLTLLSSLLTLVLILQQGKAAPVCHVTKVHMQKGKLHFRLLLYASERKKSAINLHENVVYIYIVTYISYH